MVEHNLLSKLQALVQIAVLGAGDIREGKGERGERERK
jgi:hypothetical protein